MPTIVLTNHYDGLPREIIEEQLPAGFELIILKEATKKDLMEVADRADYFLASGRVMIDEDVIEAASRLKMIQRTGVGTDTLDYDTLKKNGVPVYLNKGVNASSVAEHTIMLMLSVLKNLTEVNSQVKSGIWDKQKTGVKNNELAGKTIGLVGMGEIGQRVAGILKAFDTKVLYFDMFPLPKSKERELNIEICDYVQMLSKVDILSFHCPLTESNIKILGRKSISKLKSSAIVINTSRGQLIEESELISALRDGKIRGAGLDVYESEPLPHNSDLMKLKNVILTPHIGGVTYESFQKMMSTAMENIEYFENGQLDSLKEKRLI